MMPLLASAHQGHDHSDIPSVIRHPFVGLDHMAISAVVFVMAGVALMTAARAFASARQVRWFGAGLAAAGVALAFI